jgi:DNA-binding beta-propeller fold protein YncE
LADKGYVGCSTSDDAYAFDLDSFLPGGSIDLLPEGNYPYDATMHPDGDEVWICGASGDGVVVIARESEAVLQRIATGEYPVSIAFSADGTLALVSCRDSDRVDIVDVASYAVVDNLPIPNNYLGPGNIALDPVSGNFYLVEWYDDTLYEIAPDGSEILRQMDLGDSLWNLVVSHDGLGLYVTDRGTDQVYLLQRDSWAILNTWLVGDDPWGIDITGDDATVLVACEDSSELWFLDAGDWTASATLLAGADPRDVDVLDAGGWAFVPSGSASGPDGVFVVELAGETVLDFIDGPGGNPNVVAVQPQMSGDLTAAGEAPAPRLSLGVHPNPFNPATRIRYSLPSAGTVRLTLHDARGRRLRLLAQGPRPAGVHELGWDGRDAAGRSLASGVYLLLLESGGRRASRRLVLIE